MWWLQESFLDEFEKTLRESELQSTDFVLEGVGTAPLDDPSAADGTQAQGEGGGSRGARGLQAADARGGVW
jgi:hypothetical protein